MVKGKAIPPEKQASDHPSQGEKNKENKMPQTKKKRPNRSQCNSANHICILEEFISEYPSSLVSIIHFSLAAMGPTTSSQQTGDKEIADNKR